MDRVRETIVKMAEIMTEEFERVRDEMQVEVARGGQAVHQRQGQVEAQVNMLASEQMQTRISLE